MICDPHTDALEELQGPFVAFGIDERWNYFDSCKVELRKGHDFFLGTDGIHESRNWQGLMFGKTPILAIIRSHAGLSAKIIR